MYGKRATPPVEPDAWLAALDDVRRPQLEELDARIRTAFPEARPYVDHGFLSYGRYTYRSRAGQTGEWMCVALASNKAYISLYAGPMDISAFAARLPKASLGRGCIRFKRNADVDLEVIDEVIRDSMAYDGEHVEYGKT